MKCAFGSLLVSFALFPVLAAPDDTPASVIADVHVAVKQPGPNQFVRPLGLRAGRYDIHNATMVDLIRAAYGYDSDKILGGPSWLEMDRFDITAKMPQDTPPDMQKTMLQSVLVERFKLVVHKEDKPLPTFALRMGKKSLLKPADGSGENGCRPQSGPTSGPTGGMIVIGGAVAGGGAGAAPTPIRISADGLIAWECRNTTMSSFVSNMRTMIGANLGTNPILDETGLEGAWNFDIKYTIFGPNGQSDRVSFQEAVDKQLGLKLEPKTVPTPVIVVDKASEKPTPNPPGLEEALPPVKIPAEFDVASVKSSDPAARGGRFSAQPGGRLQVENMPLNTLLMRAFNTNNIESIAGIPKFATTDRYDITAKAPVDPTMPPLDIEAMGPMILSLLKDRFKLTYHTEDREVTVYTLVAAKPKLKKANPEVRTNCKNQPPPPGTPANSREYVCQNISMAQFAEKIQTLVPYQLLPGMYWPITDRTGIEGSWDISITFSLTATLSGHIAMARGVAEGGGAAAPPGAAAAPSAEDPGGGLTLFEALEKQAGLKLEQQKRTAKVIVIDHLEQKPTEN